MCVCICVECREKEKKSMLKEMRQNSQLANMNEG